MENLISVDRYFSHTFKLCILHTRLHFNLITLKMPRDCGLDENSGLDALVQAACSGAGRDWVQAAYSLHA